MLAHPYLTALALAVLGVVSAVSLSRTPLSPITDWVWLAGFVAAGAVLGLATKPSGRSSRKPTWDDVEDPYSRE